MDKKEVLEALDLGSSVAESDEHLVDYFVSTSFLRDLIEDRFDIVRGTKGSGKSAILKFLAAKGSTYPQLKNVHLVFATNHTGDPVFRVVFGEFERAAVESDERKLIDAWKLYWLNLILQAAPADLNNAPGAHELAKEVARYALKSHERGLVPTLKFALTRMLFPDRISFAGATGVAAGSVQADYHSTAPLNPEQPVPFGDLFRRLKEILNSREIRVWLLLDRLDEAFPGKPELEIRALRSLLYAYKDLIGAPELRIKIFLRDDIYRQVTQSNGFVALTHVAGRASTPIKWDGEGMLSLLVSRLLWNPSMKEYLRANASKSGTLTDNQVFYSLFEEKVDHGENKPSTLAWLLGRIRDGNGVMTPRDLIELVNHARSLQLEEIGRHGVGGESTLIYSSVLKRALERLSKDKIQNTLFAEYPHLRPYIERFKGSKAEQNLESLGKLFGSDPDPIAKDLVEIGFLEKLPASFKIPFLYRDGAGVTQGKAF